MAAEKSRSGEKSETRSSGPESYLIAWAQYAPGSRKGPWGEHPTRAGSDEPAFPLSVLSAPSAASFTLLSAQ